MKGASPPLSLCEVHHYGLGFVHLVFFPTKFYRAKRLSVLFSPFFLLTSSSPTQLVCKCNHFQETFRESQQKSRLSYLENPLFSNLWIHTCFFRDNRVNHFRPLHLTPHLCSLPSSLSYMHFLSLHSHSLPNAYNCYHSDSFPPHTLPPLALPFSPAFLSYPHSLSLSLSVLLSFFLFSLYSGNDTDTLRYA